jgi:hypothetical protein
VEEVAAVALKDRKLYEKLQADRLNTPPCPQCGRWGNVPDEMQVEPGTPVACELLSPERIYQYEIALASPPWITVAHNIHMLFNPDEPCGADCGVIKTRSASGLGGMSIYQRVKMTVKIEDIASLLTDFRGNQYSSTITAACPFHQGSGKELVIWTDIEEWKCYGRCQTGGDVIHFIEECYKGGFEWVLPKIASELKRLQER